MLWKKYNITKSLITSPLGKADDKICASIIYVFNHEISFEFVDKILDLGFN